MTANRTLTQYAARTTRADAHNWTLSLVLEEEDTETEGQEAAAVERGVARRMTRARIKSWRAPTRSARGAQWPSDLLLE